MNFSKFLVVLMVVFTATVSFAKDRSGPPPVAKKLATLQKFERNGTVLKLLQVTSSGSDVGYLQKLIVSSKSLVSGKWGMKITGKNSFSFEGIPGQILVRLNGQELVYGGQGYRFNSSWSLEKNIEAFAKKLSKKSAALETLIIQSAHAEGFNESGESAIKFAAALNYIVKSDAEGEKTAQQLIQVENLLTYDFVKHLSNVECFGPEGSTITDEIKFTHYDGSQSTMKLENDKLYVDGVENSWYKQDFTDLTVGYCKKSREDQVADVRYLGTLHSMVLKDQGKEGYEVFQ